MSEKPGEHLDEEPQAERGAPGTRDEGSREPSGGPVDRPAGRADDEIGESDTAVKSKDPIDPESPDLQSGG